MVQELSHLIVRIVNYLTPCTSLMHRSSQQSLTGILTSFKLLVACKRKDGGWSASYSRKRSSKICDIKENWTLRCGVQTEFLTSRNGSNKIKTLDYFNDHSVLSWKAQSEI